MNASVLNSGSGVLRMSDAVLRAKGAMGLQVKDFDGGINSDSTELVMLTSHSYTEVEFDSQGYLVKKGTTDKVADEWVVFEPCYGIEINGVQVSRTNSDDLRVIEGVTGNVSFSRADRVLKLNNAKLSELTFWLGDIRVAVEGNSTITATGHSAIATDIEIGTNNRRVTFEGVHGATLNIVATAAAVENGISVWSEMVFKNLNLNIHCDKESAIGGSDLLVVQNSSVEITGTTSKGTIYGLGDFQLRCSEISAPYKAYFASAQKAVVTAANAIVKQGLTIVPLGSVGDTTATAVGSFTWYGTTYTASGDYEHTLPSAQGCDSVVTLHLTITAPVAPATYTISTTASPAEGGSVSGAGTATEGSTVTLTATANSGYKFVRWTEGGSEVSTANPFTFTAQANRTLVAVFEKEQQPATGLFDSRIEALTLYPNPTTGELWLTVPDLVEGIAAEVLVYSAKGQLVLRVPTHGASAGSAPAAGRVRIDLSHLPTGVYIVRMGNAVAKVVRM
ncbi:MAG: T9SS type A sorting domain-containing protein [Bacteroidales bacterium]|nr:T9SS type A sorting domain-containing protein [Bacteroidales bacterium]